MSQKAEQCPVNPSDYQQPYPNDPMMEMIWRRTLIFAAEDPLACENYALETGQNLDRNSNASVKDFVAWFNKRIWRESPYPCE